MKLLNVTIQLAILSSLVLAVASCKKNKQTEKEQEQAVAPIPPIRARFQAVNINGSGKAWAAFYNEQTINTYFNGDVYLNGQKMIPYPDKALQLFGTEYLTTATWSVDALPGYYYKDTVLTPLPFGEDGFMADTLKEFDKTKPFSIELKNVSWDTLWVTLGTVTKKVPGHASTLSVVFTPQDGVTPTVAPGNKINGVISGVNTKTISIGDGRWSFETNTQRSFWFPYK